MNEGLVGGEGFAVDASVVKADANRARGVSGTEVIDWRQGDGPSRAVQEYLSALQEANPTPSDDAESAAPPKRISLTDPAARYTAAPGGPAFFAYSTNYLIDLQAGIIVDVEATPAHRTQEVESTKTMVERVEQRFDLKPRRLVGDTAYGTGAMLGWMVKDKGIDPHVPVWQRPPRSDGTVPNSEFHWVEQANEYRCPAGHAHEAARDEARAIANTPAYKRSRRERKKGDMLFAHLKRILKLDRLRLRGLSGAHDEFLLAATAQNLRRMAKWLVPASEQVETAPA